MFSGFPRKELFGQAGVGVVTEMRIADPAQRSVHRKLVRAEVVANFRDSSSQNSIN